MDDVLTEIASKWDSMDQVTQNAVTAALGGTRQREVLNTLFENWGSVEKAKKITEESDGTANKKMENYTQSIEAAQKGLTASIEKLTTSANYEKYVIMFYNLLSKLVDNLGTIIILLGGVTLARKGPSVINGIVGGVQKYGNFLSAPGRWVNDYLSNRSERNREREIAIRERGITEEEFKKEWKANIRKEKGISNLDSSIISATARMEDNKVSVGEGKNKRILTTEDYNAARNFLTDKDNNFAELSKLSEKDWERVAQAIDNGEIGDWLDSNKKVNAMKKTGNFNLNDESVFTSDREANGFIDYEARAEAMTASELTQAQQEESLKRKALAQKLGLADDATEEEIKARLRLVGALDENEDTVKTDSNTIRTRGKVANDKNVKGRLSEVPQGGKGDFIKSNGATIGAVGSMVGSVGAMYASRDLGQTAGTALTLGTSMMPMIGSIIGNVVAPGIGGAMGSAIGGIVSASIGGIAALGAALNKTSEEILQEAQKATEELNKIRDKISTAEETRSKLEDNEVRFAELVKGVNSATGKNVSLSDSEWSEYQTILSSIIDSRDDLYASYDAEGNIVAKNAQGIADLNAVMAESIQLQKDKIQQENAELAEDTKKLSKETAGNIENTKYDEEIKLENGGKVSDLSGTVNVDNLNKYKNKYGVDTYNITASDIPNIEKQKAILNLIQAGMTEDEFVEVFGNGNPNRAKEYYQQIQKSGQFQGMQESNATYSSDIKRVVGYALKGDADNFLNLSSDEQSFIQDQLFGGQGFSAFDSQGKLKDDKTIKKDMEAYQAAALKISELVKNGSINLDSIVNYDKTTDNAEKDRNYLETMINIANKSGLDEDKKESLLSEYGFIKDENGNWITNRMASQNVLSDKYGFNKDVLNDLSTEMLNALFNNKESLKSYNNKDINVLKNKLKEFTLGNNATLSQYLADFSNEMGVAISNTEEFAKALDTAKGKGTFAFEKLQKLANNLGIDIHELADHASTLGSIDANGYNSKSLSEIETQFEDIENIVNDLTDNSTISAENVEKIIKDFPELVKDLDDSDKLLEKFQSLQGDKSKSQVASLKRSFAESDEVYKSLLNDTKFDDNEDFDEIIDQKLGMFKNGRKLTEFMNTIYNKDENGKYSIKNEYNMPTTDTSSYSQNSWEKLIGENIFGIDISTGTKEDIQKKIYNAMKAQAEKMGIKNIRSLEDGGNEQLTGMFTELIGQTDFMAAFQRVSDLQNQLSALKTAKAIEDSKWEQRVSDAISKLKQDFEEGRTSIDDYIKGLQQIKTWANLTAEQQNELNEAIEEARFDKVSDQYEKGAISVKAYRDELSALMKLNASGSSQYKQYADAYISSYDTELNKLEAQKSLVAEKDFAQQRNILTKENAVYEEKLMALVAAGRQNAEEYLETQEKIKSTKEAILELDKKELEIHKEDLETTMSAYTTLLDYGISQLEKEKSLLEERYDEEIDKLKEVNDQKQRSIDLEKYQQQLENAKKEKSRVYVAGVGWTYRANQAKVDEAQRNLDNYLDDRKISDLEGSKNRESKYYQDQIDFYNEMKEKVEDVSKLASTEDAVRQLIKDGILPEGSTIPDSLDILRRNTKLDNEGHVASLGGKFESIKKDYLTTTEKLWNINSAWDQNLLDIANKIRASEPVTTKMLKEAFRASASQIDIKMPTNNSTVYKEQIADIQIKLKNAQDELGKISSSLSTVVLSKINAYYTGSSGSWKKKGGGTAYNIYTGRKQDVLGTQYYQFRNTENDKYYWTATKSNGQNLVNKNTKFYTEDDLKKLGVLGSRSNGLEGGMISRTGLYKLHGTPTNPEFVLNSKQAYQLLRNISTLSIPAFESKTSTNKTINYQFYGDMNLPNVKDPSTFFSELLREADGKFNVTKLEY